MTNNKQQTAVEWVHQMSKRYRWSATILRCGMEIQSEQAEAYATYCIKCVWEKWPLMSFEKFIKNEYIES